MERSCESLLRKRARDKVTGFEGVVTAVTAYSSGSESVLLTGRVYDPGKLAPEDWFSIQRIELISDPEVSADESAAEAADTQTESRDTTPPPVDPAHAEEQVGAGT